MFSTSKVISRAELNNDYCFDLPLHFRDFLLANLTGMMIDPNICCWNVRFERFFEGSDVGNWVSEMKINLLILVWGW